MSEVIPASIYGLKLPTRCMCSRRVTNAEQQNTCRYYIGTSSSTFDNEIHCVQYDAQTNSISLVNVYDHKYSIRHIAAAPHNVNIIATSYYNTNTQQYQCTVWHCNNTKAAHPQLERILDLNDCSGPLITSLCFNIYNEQSTELVVCEQSTGIHVYRFTNNDCREVQSDHGHGNISNPSSHHCTAIAFSPHVSNTIAAAYTDNTILVYNTLNSSVQYRVQLQTIPSNIIHSIDYNPNKPYIIVCGGTDRLLHIVDIRTGTVRTLSNHSHWIWAVKYNHVYDQLILSCGSEVINLWSIPTVSSAALLDNDKRTDNNAMDRLVESYTTDHTDSIYAIEWNGADAFIFASLSYDGRFIVHTIPQNEKYKLLL